MNMKTDLFVIVGTKPDNVLEFLAKDSNSGYPYMSGFFSRADQMLREDAEKELKRFSTDSTYYPSGGYEKVEIYEVELAFVTDLGTIRVEEDHKKALIESALLKLSLEEAAALGLTK